jgi:hypothetical protein
VCLETAKADQDGQAVHEDCYVQFLLAAANPEAGPTDRTQKITRFILRAVSYS